VLPWGGWVERELDSARARGEPLPRRLSAAEEWLLWREAVHEACSGHDVLMPDALIEPVRRAIGRLDDYGLPLTRAASAESAVLLQSRSGFRRRCAELGVLGTTSWQDCAAHLQPSASLLLAGFTALGPARWDWLERHGARLAGDPDNGVERTPAQVVGCDAGLLEAEAAAQWCAGQLERDPQARLLLVIPRLSQQRHLWQRALSQRLDFESMLTTGTGSADSPFALEGGQTLNTFPLVAVALQLITIAAGQAQFERLSAVLRSPYLAALDRNQCLRLDLWLREHNVGEVPAEALDHVAAAVGAALGETAAALLRSLIGALEPDGLRVEAAPSAWARDFAALLQRCGWPGQVSLGSEEQQVRMRFDELLGEYAAIAAPVGRLKAAEACRLLHDMAGRVAFEPASDDVAVGVTASLDDPIVRYDGIWVAGLSAEIWPPAAQPDPLLPLMLQRDAGLPEASAGGQLRLAVQRMRDWQRRAPRCVWSWSRSDADLPRDISPLLSESAASAVAPQTSEPAGTPFELHGWLAAQAPVLEVWRDNSGPAWPPGRALRGGTTLLERQALCPFRGFAELRLRATRLPEPLPGIDPRLRGKLLHLALELFWRATRDSATLRERGPEATRSLVERCVQAAGEQIGPSLVRPVAAALLRREQARAERLIGQLIEWELTREPFETQALESKRACAIGGATLQLQLDRVDRLSDGRLLVIDYKTGTVQAFDALAPRLSQPQLPAYAMAAGEGVAAVMAVYLGRDGLKLRGVADRADRLRSRGVEAVPGGESAWPALLQRWREQLQRLVREFLDGDAAVQPLSGACEYCHLQMLCRVDAQILAAAEVAAAADAAAAQAAGAIAGVEQ
jgi:ATP-dependent helicase/nuclease subunit B